MILVSHHTMPCTALLKTQLPDPKPGPQEELKQGKEWYNERWGEDGEDRGLAAATVAPVSEVTACVELSPQPSIGTEDSVSPTPGALKTSILTEASWPFSVFLSFPVKGGRPVGKVPFVMTK